MLSESSSGKMGHYRPDIDGLRALAVLGVVAAHLGIGGVTGGFGGVDVFFVISGFLIAGIIKRELESNTFSLADFYVRRIRRILPALVVCTLATTVAAALILFPDDFKPFGRSLRAVAISASNFFFGRQAVDYFGSVASDNPVLHTWSLGIEEQFYFVFPGLMYLIFRFCRPACIPVMAALAVASFFLSVRGVESTPYQVFFSTTARVWELLAGALLAFGAAQFSSGRWIREIAAVVGIFMIAACYVFYTPSTPFPGLAALPLCLGAVLVIHSGEASEPTFVGRILSSKPLVGVGLISYSVYLWHWPILSLSRYRFPDAFAASGVEFVLLQLALVTTILAVGFLSWRFIEQPFRRGRVGAPRVPVFAAAAASVGIIALAGSVSSRNALWIQQWPEQIYSLASLGRDPLPANTFGPSLEGKGWPEGTYQIGEGAGPIDTVVWGDSHALALLPGFAAFAKSESVVLAAAAHPGCPPLMGVKFFGTRFAEPCARLNEETLARVSKSDIRQVILAGYWKGFGYSLDINNQPVHIAGISASADSDEIFSARLTATVERLRLAGKQVVVLGPIPVQKFRVLPTVLRHVGWGSPLPKEIQVDEFLEQYRRVMAGMRELEMLPNVRVVYPHQRLCSAGACRYMDGEMPLYLDTNHLSAAGALYLRDMYVEALGLPNMTDIATGSTK